MSQNLIHWLREVCAAYELEPAAVYRKRGDHPWPLQANDEEDLVDQLEQGGHFLPLPTEPAALANVIEVSLSRFVLDRLAPLDDAEGHQGTERGYPDVEVSGRRFGGGYHAVDIKVARRKQNKNGSIGKNTQSRITLYTGNTYFRYPQLLWPGSFRPFQDYNSHLDLIALYTLNTETNSRIDDLELVVHESWRIASRERSSTTREYIGAVTALEDLRHGRGAFETPEAFYGYWRKFPFKIGPVVQQQLDKLLRDHGDKPAMPFG